MLFNSLQYLLFFPTVCLVYFALPQRFRWMLLLAASYYFYACWRVEYLVLILLSTAVDYGAGLGLGRAHGRWARRALLAASLGVNLGLLFGFKYLNFASESIEVVLRSFNPLYDAPLFDILLPVGISFYTFQTLGYTIDVFRGERPPERHLGRFALYVAFFPQLVAGPIERSQHLLPQFAERRRFDWDRVADGLRLMLWGFFKKLVVADRLAIFVTEVFDHPAAYDGLAVWIAAWFFAIQIYCDFSGYSDIAIGSAQVLGIRLMDNFRMPYFAANIREFWQRWHISLSTWFRDYVYIPLGGSRVSLARWQVNVLAVFLVSGLWHGASWTFVFWGALHGLYFIVASWTERARERAARAIGLDRPHPLRRAVQVLFTFHIVAFAFVFFRAESIGDAFVLLAGLFDAPEPGQSWRVALRPHDFWAGAGAVVFLFAVEAWWSRQRRAPGAGRAPLADRPLWNRILFDYAVVMAILILGKFGANPFIYFQF
jgi:D-alanyl-lipoteichoic acid acyltransferase DltB (MBOAT superfamily)